MLAVISTVYLLKTEVVRNSFEKKPG